MKVRQEIEFLRVISAFGIVWCHSIVWGSDFAYAGLASFIVISVFLAGNLRRPLNQQFARRLQVLLAPWLAWFCIYGAINIVIHKSFLPKHDDLISGVLAGTHIHLWYLPFMFVVLTGIDLLPSVIDAPVRAHLGAIGALLLLASSSLWRPATTAAGAPWMQYAQASAAVMVGLFAQGSNSIGRVTRVGYAFALVLVSLLAVSVDGVGLPYAIGIPVTLWILFVAPSWMKTTNFHALATLTFGIYLIHPPFIWLDKKYHLTHGLWTPIWVFAASAVSIAALRRLAPRVAGVLT